MQEYFQLTDIEYNSLSEKITISNFFNSVKFFNPLKTNKNISYINLFYCIDEKKKNPFNKNKKPYPWQLIFMTLFEKLDNKRKTQVLEYIELMENNYKD